MKLKKLLPIEHYTFTTKLSAQDVITRIANCMQPTSPSPFSFKTNHFEKAYTGKFIGNHFTMRRNTGNRNSYAPVITGQILNSTGKTEVEIKVQPEATSFAFTAFWLILFGLLCLGLLIAGTIQLANHVDKNVAPFAVAPFGMLIFGTCLITFAFRSESREPKTFLQKLIDGEEA